MTGTRILSLFVLLAATAACNTGNGPVSKAAVDDALAPPGVVQGAAGVDPLIVADRLLDAGEPELALESYIQAASETGLTPDLMRAMASANIQMGFLGQAERLLRKALAEDDANAAIWNDLGVVLLERGNVGEAHQAFRRAFALDPNTPQILANLRLSLARLEELRYAGEIEEEETFALTRRRDGVFELSAVE